MSEIETNSQNSNSFSAEKISLCTECDKDKADYW